MYRHRRSIFILITTLLTAALFGTTALAQDGIVWQGRYYNNANLNGSPAYTRTDNGINFNWGEGAPNGLNADNFSVQWVTQSYIEAGNYVFSLRADDYARVVVDGNTIIDTFETGELDEDVEAELSLTADVHTIRVDYQELFGPAFISLNWIQTGIVPSQPDLTVGNWTATYYDNASLRGNPVVSVTESAPMHFWGSSAPYLGVPADNFSARWTLPVADPGTYEVSVVADDGVRVYIDNTLLIDEWHTATGQTYTETFTVDAEAVRRLTVEYYEAVGNASIDFNLTHFDDVGTGNWSVQYYDNTRLSGSPIYSTSISSPTNNWGSGSPAASVPANNFSARFASTAYLDAGVHRFQVQADDGVRVIVGGTIVIDEYHASSGEVYQGDITLDAGFHNIVVDYYEAGGLAFLNYNRFLVDGGGIVSPVVTTATITAPSLNVRNAPSTLNGDVIRRVSVGETYGVVGRTVDSTWWQINLGDNTTGWVFGRFVDVANPSSVPATDQDTRPDLQPTGYAVVAETNVNVRAQAAQGSALLAVMNTGDTAQILARNASATWWLVSYQGVTGWVAAGLVSELSGIDLTQIPIE